MTPTVELTTLALPAIPPPPPACIDLIEKARTLRITNSIEYVQSCEAKLAIDDMIKNREAVHGPVVSLAYATHQAACKARNEDIAPLQAAKNIYVDACDRWRRDQEEIARQDARRQQERLDMLALEEREHEIVDAENAGATVEEVTAIAERPIYVPPVIPARPASVPKVSGFRKRPDNWKAMLDPANPSALRLLIQFVATNPQYEHLLELNQSSANALAKALKTTLQVPGLKVYNDNEGGR
jgi:hypothetical protein